MLSSYAANLPTLQRNRQTAGDMSCNQMFTDEAKYLHNGEGTSLESCILGTILQSYTNPYVHLSITSSTQYIHRFTLRTSFTRETPSSWSCPLDPSIKQSNAMAHLVNGRRRGRVPVYVFPGHESIIIYIKRPVQKYTRHEVERFT